MTEKTGKVILLNKETFYLSAYQDFYNKRLKIEDLRGNIDEIIQTITQLGEQPHVEKIIVKARNESVEPLLEKGFLIEAKVPGYFLGGDGYFLCKYKNLDRYNSGKWCEEDEILDGVWQKEKQEQISLEKGLALRMADRKDAPMLSSFYQSVFPIYPVPIDDPNYIIKQMDEDTIFILVEENGRILAAASAEINDEYKNAEITDCATLPSMRKGGFMNHIISNLEKELVKRQVYCSYSIARALSFGMNAVLHNLHYTYKGRLKNNCYIFDNIEDMNVWYKDLSLTFAEKPAHDAGN
ncbi:putative beta-lysine N-acetyltransferase [Sutcliffiella horikoshii]|uniref:putative beta-lysine N-acetyltransferase n=1 Tax=Sutcliffiella horikoshii TaxID=79883 RepID=UPI00203DD556|nr:putative beta-lysine N-acetyltransferase [Sutcliffiella horikoshii]MCM3617212.1 putative beta-lysine N-acetyltransferase [Sutcliffiella horikoshii]